MWDEKEIEQCLAEYCIGKKSWHRRVVVMLAAAIVPMALMINIIAPTVKTFAAERVYAQTVAEHKFVQNFTTLRKHVLPNSNVYAIIYLNLPETWQISTMTINQQSYELQPGHDCYLIKLTTPKELGHWEVKLDKINIFDGELYHEIMIEQTELLEVETHMPHFEEVHPEKPQIQSDNQDSQDYQQDTNYQVGEKIKFDARFKMSEGERIKQIEKYELDDESVFRRTIKFKEKPEFLSEHGEIVAIVLHNLLYPAVVQPDGQLQIYGLDSTGIIEQIQYVIYEDGCVVPASRFIF